MIDKTPKSTRGYLLSPVSVPDVSIPCCWDVRQAGYHNSRVSASPRWPSVQQGQPVLTEGVGRDGSADRQ